MPDHAAIAVTAAGQADGTTKCPSCGGRVHPAQESCPHCGHKMRGAAAAAALQAILKSGNIEQGYASCLVDPMMEAIRTGKCDPRRIQCNIPVTIAADALAGGATLVYTITPVGYSVLRRIEATLVAPDVAAAADFRPVVTQVAAKGVFTVTAEVAVAPANAANVASGFLLNSFAGNFQNYTAPSGIPFSESNPLRVTITNEGADTGSFETTWFYDGSREG